jgi:hypothetical protein
MSTGLGAGGGPISSATAAITRSSTLVGTGSTLGFGSSAGRSVTMTDWSAPLLRRRGLRTGRCRQLRCAASSSPKTGGSPWNGSGTYVAGLGASSSVGDSMAAFLLPPPRL